MARRIVPELAAMVYAINSADASAQLADKAARHALDAIGNAICGSWTDEGRATVAALHRILPAAVRDDPLQDVSFLGGSLCASARLTECDDIHLASCTTPGAVVFPALLAAHRIAPCTESRAVDAAIAGYAVMTAAGTACDGANAVYSGPWPTYLASCVAAASIAGKILGLSEARLGDAIAIAASMSVGTAGRSDDPTSRWLTLAASVVRGLVAAAGAEAGLKGDAGLLDSVRPDLPLTPDQWPVLDAEQAAEALMETAMKPFCAGRQSLAAIEAFMTVCREHSISAAAIDRIVVEVPGQCRAMIDRPLPPRTKMDSRGVAYQIALAALDPDSLFDIDRRQFRQDPESLRLMACVEVAESARLTSLYPYRWGAAVSVHEGPRVYRKEIELPKGDPDRSLAMDEIETKLNRTARSVSVAWPVPDLSAAIGDWQLAEVLRIASAHGNWEGGYRQ